MNNTSDWHGRVYKKMPREHRQQDWDGLRAFIITRDKYMCLRCDRHFPKSKLSVHHLIPRSDGGGDNPENLVTLCHDCHDYVEINEYRTTTEIVASYDVEVITPDDTASSSTPEADPYNRPEWHKWVYGGARNPVLDKKATS